MVIIAGDGSLVQGNKIENSPGWGIQASGNVTMQGNRLVGNASGIQASGGTVQGNLVANSAGVGLEINGDASVTDNTFIGNAGNTIVINAGVPTIQDNNLEGNTGTYDIQNLSENDIPADGNWWGTTNTSAIPQRIFDYDDGDYSLGKVLYFPSATGPIQTAPAYVRSVTLDPESPVGIETVTFEVEFSCPMDQAAVLEISFLSVLQNTWAVYNSSNSGLPSSPVDSIASDTDGTHWFGMWDGGVAKLDGGTWTVYNTSNSGLPRNFVKAIASDPDGSHWFGTDGGGVAKFDDTTWTVYNTSNSGLPNDIVMAITSDLDGSLWFGTAGGGLAKFDGSTWTVYNTSNSGLPHDVVYDITLDPDGTLWLATGGGALEFDGNTWIVYNTSNSGLPNDLVKSIASDPDGAHWFSTYVSGVSKLNGSSWIVYNTSNSGLPESVVHDITSDPDGSLWFGTGGGGAARFDDITWAVYNPSNSGLPSEYVYAVDRDSDGSHWFGTGLGVGVLWNYPKNLILDNPLWLDDTHYQVSFDITSLIPLGDYRITVDGAVGGDGIQIAPNSATTFTVDYAGAVSDTTPPAVPIVTACAGETPDNLSASWTASDPESSITLYQYAIGTTPGGTEVINWTSTSVTSFDLHGLTLTPGQLYYISVKARNAGGLWSAPATPDGLLPGSATCTTNLYVAYLSLVRK